ncbi:MAG TPA: hypothetical protein VJT54_07705 [Verrucomicrobiae bacterium]|nr:hypothetical protein [Verrucomicrobiae bacterium]
MKLKTTFVTLVSIAGAVPFLAAIAIPNFGGGSRTSPQNACINNLRYLDWAKDEWATNKHKTNGSVSWNDILPYLTNIQKEQGRKVGTPRCPGGGIYTLGDVGEPPKCSIEGHVIPSP